MCVLFNIEWMDLTMRERHFIHFNYSLLTEQLDYFGKVAVSPQKSRHFPLPRLMWPAPPLLRPLLSFSSSLLTLCTLGAVKTYLTRNHQLLARSPKAVPPETGVPNLWPLYSAFTTIPRAGSSLKRNCRILAGSYFIVSRFSKGCIDPLINSD